MEFRRHDEPPPRPLRPPDVGVDEPRLPTRYGDEDRNGRGRQAERDQRAERRDAQEQQIERVKSESDEPVHLLRRMMDGVKAPQPRKRVLQTMDAVDAEVSN